MVDKRISVGDAVSLRSGGPVMTVKALSMSLAYCAWKAGGRLHQGTFEVDSLEWVGGGRDQPARLEQEDTAGKRAG